MTLSAFKMFKDKPILGHGVKVSDLIVKKNLIKSMILTLTILDLTVETIHIILIFN